MHSLWWNVNNDKNTIISIQPVDSRIIPWKQPDSITLVSQDEFMALLRIVRANNARLNMMQNFVTNQVTNAEIAAPWNEAAEIIEANKKILNKFWENWE